MDCFTMTTHIFVVERHGISYKDYLVRQEGVKGTITKHLKTVFGSGELIENSACADYAHAVDGGKTYQYNYYFHIPRRCFLNPSSNDVEGRGTPAFFNLPKS